MTNALRIHVAVFFYVLVVAAARAQVSPMTHASGEAGQVAVQFFVLGHHGVPTKGISQTDVSILDEGTPPQSVVSIHVGAELPLRLGILIDTSNSQRKNSQLFLAAVDATTTFMNQVVRAEQDKVFIGKFETIAEATGFMDKKQLSKYKVDLAYGGGTSLYDAIVLACEGRMLKDDVHPVRRVLVLVTDGEDNQSRANRDTAVAAAQRAGVAVFAVSTNSTGTQLKGDTVLEKIAHLTGGESFLQLGRKDMTKVFSKIAEQIDGMYVMMYTPANAAHDGKFHSIHLKLSTSDKLAVRAPKGYYSVQAPPR